MPGLTNNINILAANNQFIQSQNDIETALLAGSEITAEQLRIMGLWHPYLQYLKYLQAIAEQGPLAGPGERSTYPGEFQDDNEVYLSEKCIAANWIYQSIWNGFDYADDNRFWEVTGVTTTALIAGLSGVFAAAIAAPLLPAAIIVAIPTIVISVYFATNFRASVVLAALVANKDDIIRSIYNAVSLHLITLRLILPGAKISNISANVIEIISVTQPLTQLEQQVIGLIIDYYALTALFKDSSSWPSKWQAGPPVGASSCTETPLENTCGYTSSFIGTPDLLDGDVLSSGTVSPLGHYPALVVIYLSLPYAITITDVPPSGTLRFYTCNGEEGVMTDYDLAVDPMPEMPVNCFGFSVSRPDYGEWTVTYTCEAL